MLYEIYFSFGVNQWSKKATLTNHYVTYMILQENVYKTSY